eukprot:GHVT01031744.1.p2 GENE.GHVT01031744.1~~GHVT01031744.1.p2  ORF type:complete len:292 (-),score=22.69 GHVT01031744.1:3551-4426(-)
MRWSTLEGISNPEELKEKLAAQQAFCRTIEKSKDRRIGELVAEEKRKDENYVQGLKRQSEIFDNMVFSLNDGYRKLALNFTDALQEIERAINQERGDILARNKNALDQLFDRRRHLEECEYIETRQQRETTAQNKLAELRLQDEYDFSRSKFELEQSQQRLELHYAKMEASYQLAGEKLQHNVQVLTERNKDHATMLTSHKGRYNRLRETISNIMSRYTTMETKMRHSNMELTEEYKRLTVQYNAMRNKYRQFEIASDSKFKKCWEMNERQVRTTWVFASTSSTLVAGSGR